MLLVNPWTLSALIAMVVAFYASARLSTAAPSGPPSGLPVSFAIAAFSCPARNLAGQTRGPFHDRPSFRISSVWAKPALGDRDERTARRRPDAPTSLALAGRFSAPALREGDDA